MEDIENALEIENFEIVEKNNKEGELIIEELPPLTDIPNDELLNKVNKWVTGEDTVPDKDIQTLLQGTKSKAEVINSYIVSAGVKKIKKLQSFIDTAEGRLFQADDIQTMAKDELVFLYKLALSRQREIYNLNEEYMSKPDLMDGDMQRLTSILTSLSPEQVKNLLIAVSNMKNKHKEE